MNRFKIAYLAVKTIEGVYSNDATDTGGETVFGIARNKNPHWSGWAYVDALKAKATSTTHLISMLKNEPIVLSLAESFYKTNYWDTLCLDEINDYPVAFELYDTAVNQGVGAASKYLQQALNYLNNGGVIYPDLTVDGSVGPKTMEAYKKYINTGNWSSRTPANVVATLVKTLNGLQFLKYVTIVKNSPSQEKYFFGWINTRI